MGNKSSSSKSSKPKQQTQGKNKDASQTATRETPHTDEDFFLRPMGHHGLPHSVCAMAYTNIQRFLAVGTSTGVVKLFGKNGIEILLENQNSRSAIISLSFNRSGSKLIIFSADTEFRVIDTSTYQILGGLSSGWTRGAHINCVHMPPDTDHPFIYVGLDNGYVEVINILTCERTGYSINSQSIDIDSEEEDLIFMISDPSDLNKLLLGYEKSGAILWDLTKKRIIKRFTTLTTLTNDTSEPSALTCGAFHDSGHQFCLGYTSGHLVIYDSSKSNSGKIQNIGHALNPIEFPKPVTSVRWGSNNRGRDGPGTLIVAGGNDMNAVTILWQNKSHQKEKTWKCSDVGIPGLDEHSLVYGMALPTWDESPVLDIQLTYPQGYGPFSNCLDSNPNGYIIMSGDPQEGVHVRLGIQPLPTFPKNPDVMWPPAACDPPEPMPQILHFSGVLRGLHIRTIVDCGVCPNDVIEAIKRNRPSPHGHPNAWKWPITGGETVPSASDPKGAQHLLATGHIDGTVGIWACGPPGDNKVSMKMACLSSACECIYEFEPRFLCEQSGYKPPNRPKPFSITLCLQSRLLCIGCESGDVLVCTVKPSGLAGGDSTETTKSTNTNTSTNAQNNTGSAVYLLHCLQGVHTAPITHLSLMAQSGVLAIADRNGQISLLDLSTGISTLLAIPIPKMREPIRSMISGSVPCVPEPIATGDTSSPAGSAADSEGDKSGQEEEMISVPMLFIGLADGTIAVCSLSTGDGGAPLCLILPPPTKKSTEPINFMVLMNKRGVPPIEPVSRTFTKQDNNKNKSNATDATDETDGKDAVNAVDADKSHTESSKLPIGRRFLLIVAGPEARVIELKFPSISSMLTKGMLPIHIQTSKSAQFRSPPVSISCSSIFASAFTQPGEFPCLVGIDQFNHMTCLSLPFLNTVYEDDVTAFEDIEDRRCACIMASGDAILATNMSALHRYSLSIVSLLGYSQRPSAFKLEWGSKTESKKNDHWHAVRCSMNEKDYLKAKKKKTKRNTIKIGFLSTVKLPADLTKIFGTAQLRMEQEQEMNHRELGLLEEDDEEDEDGDTMNNASATGRAQNALGETHNVMSENMNKLNERGEKIQQIQEQTSRMVLNAMRFEEQCKQIKKNQQDDCVVM